MTLFYTPLRSYHQLPKHILSLEPFLYVYLWNGSFPLWLVTRIMRWWRPWMMPLSIAWRSDKSDGMHFGLMVWPKTTSSNSICWENPLDDVAPAEHTKNTNNTSGLWDVFTVWDALPIVISDVWFEAEPYTATGYCDICWWHYLTSSPAPISKGVVPFAFPTICLWSYFHTHLNTSSNSFGLSSSSKKNHVFGINLHLGNMKKNSGRYRGLGGRSADGLLRSRRYLWGNEKAMVSWCLLLVIEDWWLLLVVVVVVDGSERCDFWTKTSKIC